MILEVFNKLNLQSIIMIPFSAPTGAHGFKMLYVLALYYSKKDPRGPSSNPKRIAARLNVLRVESSFFI